ncbi:tetratricopeptide repeat protein [Thermocrispum sp.]|uniref:tetratricopeptide repeat protein n=1 Tax=Thermocrispum sp. TaxID=2060768 RepID=UPI00257AB689|nr:tetratricopeptide repeat protein [Thermocrispum sp.]
MAIVGEGDEAAGDTEGRAMGRDWETELAEVWAQLDDLPPETFRRRIDELAARCPHGGGVADFERASAFDSTDCPEQAVALYQQALSAGLTGLRRRRAVIQLASSLRNVGRAEEGVRLLERELETHSDELDDAVRATLALALADVGRSREAVGHAVYALSRHLPRYQRSMAAYGRELIDSARP